MQSLRIAALLSGAVLLAACTPPEKSIEKDCVRLEMFSEMGADAAGNKKSCACLADKVKESMAKDELKKLAALLKSAKTKDEVDPSTQSADKKLSDASSMAFMGAAKSCAMQ
jgi:hypothetical protein